MEEKTLSEKMIVSEGRITQFAPLFYVKDVKQTFKEILEFHPTTKDKSIIYGVNLMKDLIKQKAGEDLK